MGELEKLRRKIGILSRMCALWEQGEPGAERWLCNHLAELDKRKCELKATIQYGQDCCVVMLGRGEDGQWEYRSVPEEEAVQLEQAGWKRLASGQQRAQGSDGGRLT